MTRTSTVIAVCPPTRKNSLSASTRSKRVCSASDMSPISSRNSVPPLACSKRPMRRSVAPVNAPFSWPNSSDSSSSAAIADVFSATNGAVGARRVVVQRARDELLARAGLARDQHRHARARQAADRLEHLLHRRRLADDARRRLRGRLLGRSARALPRRARDELDRFVDVERLRQILEGAALIGRHGAVEIRVRRDDDDGDVGIHAREPLHELEPAHVRHADVRDQHVGPAELQRAEELLAGFEGAREHVRLLQRLLEHPPHGLVVVDDPNGQTGRCHQRAPLATGKRIWKTVRPGSLVNSMSPPFRLTRSCAIVSPSPVPVGRPVTSG